MLCNKTKPLRLQTRQSRRTSSHLAPRHLTVVKNKRSPNETLKDVDSRRHGRCKSAEISVGPKQNPQPAQKTSWGSQKTNPGNDLLSHMVAHAVPSAPKSLTSEFGMGSGMASSISLPENFRVVHARTHAPSSAREISLRVF